MSSRLDPVSQQQHGRRAPPPPRPQVLAWLALLALIATLFLRPAEMWPSIFAAIPLAKIFVALAVLSLVLHKLLHRDFSWPAAQQTRWFALLLAGSLAASLWGSDPRTSLTDWLDSLGKFAIVHLLVLHLVDSPKRAVHLQSTLATLCSLLGGYALWCYGTGRAHIEGSRAAFVGLLSDPNDLAFTLLIGAPFLIAATWQAHAAKRLLWAGQLTLVLGGIMATQSRGGLFALLCGASAVAHTCHKEQRRRHRHHFPALYRLLAVAGLLGVAGQAYYLRLTQSTTAAPAPRYARQDAAQLLDTSARGRLDAWKNAWRMFLDHPGLGVGFNRFADNFAHYNPTPVTEHAMAAHNCFLNVLAETGLAGFIPFMALFWLAWRSSRFLRRAGAASTNATFSSLLQAAPATLLGLAAAGLFLSQSWNWFLYLVMAQIAAHERLARIK